MRTDPTDPFDPTQRLEQLCECCALGQVTTVGNRVLADQVELDHSGLGKPFGLADQVVDGSRPLLPSKGRNGTEATRAIAPFRDFHIGAVYGFGEDPRVIRAHRVLRRVADQHAFFPTLEDRVQLQHVARAEEVIDLGHFSLELLRVPLRQASCNDEFLAGAPFLVGPHLENRVDRFFFGGPDEAARVDDNHLGLSRIIHVSEARLVADPEHDLGVDPVLRRTRATRNGWSEAPPCRLITCKFRPPLAAAPARPKCRSPRFALLAECRYKARLHASWGKAPGFRVVFVSGA